jgi:hypothetical protein
MSSSVEYPNTLSRLILKRHSEKQFVIPQEPPPKPVERFMTWYEQKVLNVDTRNIKIDRPIFLTGLPRSGTTILQDIFCAHPRVAYFTNSMHQFPKCFCAVEDLRKRLNLDFRTERYLGDSIKIGAGSPNEGHIFFAEWRQVDPYSLDYTELRFEDLSAYEIERARETIRKVIWCFGGQANRFFNKNPGLIPYVLSTKDMFPEAKIIHIVRDARMCANSMLKLYRRNQAQEAKIRAQLGDRARTGDFFVPYPRLPKLTQYIKEYGVEDIRTTAHIWNDAISFINKVKDQLPFFYEVRYEDILANPTAEINKLLEFCELPEIEDRQARFWQTVNKIGRVQHANQYGDFEVVEAICGPNMKLYGYV